MYVAVRLPAIGCRGREIRRARFFGNRGAFRRRFIIQQNPRGVRKREADFLGNFLECFQQVLRVLDTVIHLRFPERFRLFAAGRQLECRNLVLQKLLAQFHLHLRR